jgi:hypothetical protein
MAHPKAGRNMFAKAGCEAGVARVFELLIEGRCI